MSVKILLRRIIFVLTAVFFTAYSAAMLGRGIWGTALILLTVPVGFSLFQNKLNGIAQAVLKVTATLAGFALVLTLIGATIGGQFHISLEVWPLVICFVVFILLGIFDRPPKLSNTD